MKLAIPVEENGQLAEHFSRARTFALYEIKNETHAVEYLGRQVIEEPGCGRTPPFLKTHEVEVVLGHDVSENAVEQLNAVGILAVRNVPILPSDAVMAHLVSGTLKVATPEGAAQGAGGCGSQGGCGHCGGGHAHVDQLCVETQGSHGEDDPIGKCAP